MTITPEELEKLLQEASKPLKKGEKATPLSEMQSFLAATNILPGNVKVSATKLWLQYTKWSPKPMKRIEFYMRLKEELGHCRKETNGGVHYYINNAKIDITDKEYNLELRNTYKERNYAGKK